MDISFNSVNFSAVLRKLEFRNVTTIKTDKSIYTLPFTTIQGVEGVSFPVSGLPELNLQYNALSDNSRTDKVMLCVFFGNKPIKVANFDTTVAINEEILFAFSEGQQFKFTIPSQFNGHLYFFLVTNEWHEYDTLKSINLPKLSTYSGDSTLKIGRTIHTENIGSLEKASLTTQLFFDCVVELTNKSKQSSVDTEKISQVSSFLAESITKNQPTLAELAHLTNMSISSLKVKFKTQHGKTVKDFFIEKKMDYARELLKQGKRIKEIAAILGYKAPQSFSSAFKRTQGFSPSDIKTHTYINR